MAPRPSSGSRPLLDCCCGGVRRGTTFFGLVLFSLASLLWLSNYPKWFSDSATVLNSKNLPSAPANSPLVHYRDFMKRALQGTVDWNFKSSSGTNARPCHACNCSRIWQSVVGDDGGRFCADLELAIAELRRVTSAIMHPNCTGHSCTSPLSVRTGKLQSSRTTRLKIFVADYHTGLVRDLKHFFATWLQARLGAVEIDFVDQSLSAYCQIQSPPTCIRNHEIAFIRRENAWPECPSQAAFQAGFWDALKTDSVLQTIDIFMCTLPIWGCLRYIPFNRPFILIDAVDLGAKPQMHAVLTALQRQRFSKMTLAYNYAGGIHKPWRPIYLPSFSGYSGIMQIERLLARNNSKAVLVLVHVKGGSRQRFMNVDLNLQELETTLNMLERRGTSLQPLRTFKVQNLMVATPSFNLSAVTDPMSEFAASIIVSTSWQIVFMSGYELYRTNIPLFFPTKQLQEKGDFTYYPGIQYYASVKDLAAKIIATNITYYNTVVGVFNHALGHALADVWAWRFSEMLPGLLNGTYVRPSHNANLSIAEAWTAATGLTWSPEPDIVNCIAPDQVFAKSPHTP